MVYQFLNFTFDNQSLALQKEGADVDIRPYEAKLLAFLIENREKVVSKQEILTQVWQDKVVAEQVIFQNISHLRALFGSSAIKTFPKRGYQWQIDTLSFICEEKSLPQAESITINSQPEKLSSQHYFVLSVAVFTIFLFALFSFNIGDEKDLKVGVIPFESKGFELAADDIVTPTITYESVDDITAERFMTSAELVFTSLNNEFDVVVTGSTRTYKDKFYLDFIVKGPAEKWQGQIQGQSIEHVIQTLNTHLSQQVIFELVTVEMSPEGKTAMLTLAHQNAPDDLIILAQLIEKMIDAQELDKAMVLSEKLAANAQAVGNQQQLGIAYTLQSNILTNKEVYALSREKLKMANEALINVNDLKRQADLWEAQSWLDHQKRDYESIKQSLLTSSRLGLEAGDKKRELHALTYLTVMGHKYSKTDDKYGYLQHAEAKMKEYNLPLYHFAKIPFHYAIFAKSPQEKEPHYKTVLEYTALIPNYWVAQVSRKRLLLRYIETKRLEEAQALIRSLSSDNAHNNYLRMLLARVEANNQSFVALGQKAFEQAAFAGDKQLSLDVALLLCDADELHNNFDFYSKYIRENASDGWRRANEEKLLALNI